MCSEIHWCILNYIGVFHNTDVFWITPMYFELHRCTLNSLMYFELHWWFWKLGRRPKLKILSKTRLISFTRQIQTIITINIWNTLMWSDKLTSSSHSRCCVTKNQLKVFILNIHHKINSVKNGYRLRLKRCRMRIFTLKSA